MSLKSELERLYRRYNRRKYVSPDPLQFLYRYDDARDREIAALVASALAYGRVAQILRSVEIVLSGLGPSPRAFLMQTSGARLKKMFPDFRHRFTACNELVELMIGIRNIISEHGSLNRCFLAGLSASDETVLPAIRKFAARLRADCAPSPCCLIPDPARGSACKRLNLFLRWMARRDAVDPGGWKGVPRSKLIVPLDTHMGAIGRMFGLTQRKADDIKTALEITCAFRAFAPRDPVKYDFALTRFGIRDELTLEHLSRSGC